MKDELERSTSLIAVFVAAVPLTLWSGFVLWKLWAWFIVPIGVAQISYPLAIGFDLFAKIISPYKPKRMKGATTTEAAIETITYYISKPAIYLLIGLIIKAFV